mgnify:CR=1 FL=1
MPHVADALSAGRLGPAHVDLLANANAGNRCEAFGVDEAWLVEQCSLQRYPELMLDPDMRRQTSYFERLADVNPDELAAGLERLRADLDAGVDPRERIAAARERIGDLALLAYRRQPPASTTS